MEVFRRAFLRGGRFAPLAESELVLRRGMSLVIYVSNVHGIYTHLPRTLLS